MSTASAAPLFFGGLDPSGEGSLQEASLKLAAVLDDGVLAGGEDRAIGRSGGEVVHLADIVGIAADEVLVRGIDLQGDDLP